MCIKKPPLGLRPKRFSDMDRVAEILEAMDRYNSALEPIPREWFDELELLLYPVVKISG